MPKLFRKAKVPTSQREESVWRVLNEADGDIRCHNIQNNHILVISRRGELWSLTYSTPGGVVKRVKAPTHDIEKLRENIEYFDKEIAGGTLKESKDKIVTFLKGKILNQSERKAKAKL